MNKEKVFTWEDVRNYQKSLPRLAKGFDASFNGVMRLMVVGLVEAFQKTIALALKEHEDVEKLRAAGRLALEVLEEANFQKWCFECRNTIFKDADHDSNCELIVAINGLRAAGIEVEK